MNEDSNLKDEEKEIALYERITNLNEINIQIINTTKLKRYLPKLTKNYKLTPSYEYILNHSTEESLKNVLCFEIENEHGSIQFLTPVNLCNVNLDDIVIERKVVNLLTDNPGHPLNKSVVVKLKNLLEEDKLASMDENQYQATLNKIKKLCEKMKVLLF